MSANVITLFISSVTDEFGEWRARLHKDLTQDGLINVIRQEQLHKLGEDTLPTLDLHISQCDAVVHFVGDQTGGPPRRNEVPTLLRRYGDLKNVLRLDDEAIESLTRTQWEALLAIYHKKRLFIARPRHRGESGTSADVAQRGRQEAHLQRLFQWIKDTVEFDSYETLLNKLHQSLHAIRAYSDSYQHTPADPATVAHLHTLHTRVLAGGEPQPLEESALEAIDRHVPQTLSEYHLRQIAHWSLAVHRIDRDFTPLALRLNLENDTVDRAHSDLRDVLKILDSKHQRALVIFGPPGAGKSTLLRRLGYDLAMDALRAQNANGTQPRVPFYAELRRFELTAERASPRTWLSGQWHDHGFDRIGDFDELLQRGQLLLLLDAINEIPCTPEEYDKLLIQWSNFLSAHGPDNLPAGNQAVFSCRRLDYSIGLQVEKKTVAHVEVESLTPEKIKLFLDRYLDGRSDLAEATYATLAADKTFDLYNSPFYLTLLVALVKAGGVVPRGRASLFSAFAREAVQRERTTNRLFARNGLLLSAEDYDQVRDNAWNNDHDLPADRGLFNGLAALAHDMQVSAGASDREHSHGLIVKADAARKILAPHATGGASADDLLKGAVDLHLLERNTRSREVQFRHQLFQEYFAARKLVAELAGAAPGAMAGLAYTAAQRAHQPWRAKDIRPTVEEELARLGPGERLNALTPTGWEETLKLATAMMENAEPLVRALMDTRLDLAGVCAAQPEARLGAALRDELRQQLLARSRDTATDLRARIAAGMALGELGDPRLTPGPLPENGNPDARAMFPPFVTIAAGEYALGVDSTEVPEEFRQYFEDARPVRVTIPAAFDMAQFPVTNAEWRRFMAAGGYGEDQPWWQSDGAREWHSGKATGDAARRSNRYWRKLFVEDPDAFAARREASGDPDSFKVVETWAAMDDAAFEKMLLDRHKDIPLKEPAYWRNPAFNGPAQPVVGVCWFEALAYCAWLSAEAARAGSSYRYRLPTEIEWEGTAGGPGTSGRSYAWGNDWDATYCNTPDTRIKSTTPVGVFPHGDTLWAQPISDLSGNVYEWTSTLYRPTIDELDDGREDLNPVRDDAGEPLPRVVRGGSWDDYAVYARVAYRYYHDPGVRGYGIGFRVVRVSHP